MLSADVILIGIIHKHVFHILIGPKVLVRFIRLIQVDKELFSTKILTHLNILLREYVTVNHIQSVIHDLMVAMDRID